MNSINDLVSIIIPVYNAEKYVSRCIESLLRQTYTKFEIILVNDASQDASFHICEEYSKCDTRVSVTHVEKNGGLSRTRNLGLEKATGEYIFFVDDDDYVTEDYLESFMQKNYNGIDFVGAGYVKEYADGKRETYAIPEMRLSLDECKKKICAQEPMHYIPVWAARYKRSIIETYHLRFDETVRISEDLIFNLNYFEKAESFFFTSELGYMYQIRDGSGMHRFAENRHKEVREEAQMLEKFVKGYGAYYRLKYYYWHMALAHYYRYLNAEKNAEQKKKIRKRITNVYKDSYFRSCMPDIRTMGALDEKIETYCMSFYGHKMYLLLMKLLNIYGKLRKK